MDESPKYIDALAGTPLDSYEISMINVSNHLSFSFARKYRVIMCNETNEFIVVYYQEPLCSQCMIELRRIAQKSLKLQLIDEKQFEKLLSDSYEATSTFSMHSMSDIEEEFDLDMLVQHLPKTTDLLEIENDAPVIRLLNAILTQAIKQKTSDVHFETFDERLVIRFRIDGLLREVLTPPRVLAPLIISRVKVMSKLDIAEKRLPQDGRISLKIAGRAVDVRVSTFPTHYGERVVLRLLDKQSVPLDLSQLGMSSSDLTVMKQLSAKPHGILLVTGPTGSGKTTTLYALLSALNRASANILTVEDPIEFDLPGIGQTQVNTKIGMTFARGLRAILRQDPDVVMIGEIRDKETMDMAIQASLTGHLVLSTLHTNSAIGAITRLRDMNAESFLLSSTIIGVIAQRLVRLLCKHCKKIIIVDERLSDWFSFSEKKPETIYSAVGCEQCARTGYQGRTGIYNVIAVDEVLQAMIHANDSEAAMEKYTRQFSSSMREDGFRKVMKGITTIEEVLRVT